MNIFEIIEAWVIAKNPNERQKEIANKRAVICNDCEFSSQIIKGLEISIICNNCGCPLVKKIYTNKYNPCPHRKWAEIDEPYFKQKNDKTLF